MSAKTNHHEPPADPALTNGLGIGIPQQRAKHRQVTLSLLFRFQHPLLHTEKGEEESGEEESGEEESGEKKDHHHQRGSCQLGLVEIYPCGQMT